MLLTELRIQLGKSFILAAPGVDLFLQGADLVVFGLVLHLKIRIQLTQLLLEVFHPTIVLLEHELIPFVLCPRIQVLSFKLGQTALGLCLVLLTHQLFLRQSLLLSLQSLLLLEVMLSLLLGQQLLSLLLFVLLLQLPLLRLVLILLSPRFLCPEVVNWLWIG